MSIFKTVQDIAKEEFEKQSKLNDQLRDALAIGNISDIERIKEEQRKEKVRTFVSRTIFFTVFFIVLYFIYWALAQGLCKFNVFGDFCKSIPGVTIINQTESPRNIDEQNKILTNQIANLQKEIDSLKSKTNNPQKPFISESTLAAKVLRAENNLCVGNICVNERIFRQTFGNGSGIPEVSTQE